MHQLPSRLTVHAIQCASVCVTHTQIVIKSLQIHVARRLMPQSLKAACIISAGSCLHARPLCALALLPGSYLPWQAQLTNSTYMYTTEIVADEPEEPKVATIPLLWYISS